MRNYVTILHLPKCYYQSNTDKTYSKSKAIKTFFWTKNGTVLLYQRHLYT